MLALHFASEQDCKNRKIRSASIEIQTGDLVGQGYTGHFVVRETQNIELDPVKDDALIRDGRWDIQLDPHDDPDIVADCGWYEEYRLKTDLFTLDDEEDGNQTWLESELTLRGYLTED